MTEYLDADDVLVIAEALLGKAEVRDLGLLHAALGNPQQSFDGVDLYPTLELKAAAMLRSLAGPGQWLVDGNKRVAFAVTLYFLHRNDVHLRYNYWEAYGLTMAVANDAVDDLEAIARFFSEREITGPTLVQ